MDKDEIILIVKKAIANNSLPFEDSDEFVELDGFDVDNIADEVYEALYTAGYRKVPEDSVVLSKEEYEMLANQYKNLEIKYSNLCDNYKLCKDANEMSKRNVVATRKETAREILIEIQTEIFRCLGVKNMKETDKLSLLGSPITYDLITDKLYELSKQYGVKIGE